MIIIIFVLVILGTIGLIWWKNIIKPVKDLVVEGIDVKNLKYYSFDKESGWLSIYKRTPLLESKITIKEYKRINYSYNSPKLLYTSATVGGITTGGVDVIKGSYSPTSEEKTGKYILCYRGEEIKELGIIDQLEEAKKHPVLQQFINESSPGFTLKHKVKITLSEYEKNELSKAIRDNDYQVMSALTKEGTIQEKLTYDECKAIKDWICGIDGIDDRRFKKAKTKNTNKFAIIAAICFTLLGVYSLLNTYTSIAGGYFSIIGIYCIIGILSLLTTIGFAVTLFLKNKIGATIASGVSTALCIFYIIEGFHPYNVLTIFAYASLLIMLILSIKNNPFARKIWFLCGALLFVATLLDWIIFGYSVDGLDILLTLIRITGLLFIGLWIKGSEYVEKATPINEYATFNPQSVSTPIASDVIGGADEIKMYKELLDLGAITQDEFNAKKKQILGL